MRPALIALLILALAACAGGPRARMFPPAASVQEIQLTADGRWQLAVRLQNNARLPIRMSGLKATLTIDGRVAANIDMPLDMLIASSGAERLEITIVPSPDAAAAVSAALASRRAVDYAIAGVLSTIEPSRRRDDFQFQSRLSPAPGLPDTLR